MDILSPASARPVSGRSPGALLRRFAAVALLALLSACATQHVSPSQEAADYLSHARGNYTPPGPPEDPWGPYITEASARFDVPDRWVREVMRVESGGRLYRNGELTTSGVGAMGLMQVMPETYDGLRDRYSLGEDAYDPHNNILAGAAYIREMYDLYGSPGFLAAYNAGPKRLDDYLTRHRPLPDETRHYVAMIGPNIIDSHPVNRSPAEDYAMNALPVHIPAGPRFGRGYARASTQYARVQPVSQPGHGAPVVVAQLPAPPPPSSAPARSGQRVALAANTAPPPRGSSRFRLIPAALADTLPQTHGGPATGQWAIQVGAFGSQGDAKAAVGAARDKARDALSHAHPMVASVQKGHGTLYRARLTGLSHDAAVQACERVSHGHGNCIVLSPDAQS